MKPARKQRGFLLIVAVVLIAVAAVMAVVIATLTAGSGQSGGLHVSSTQALFAAESGMEQATRLFQNGTSCANLPATIGTQTVGNASYSVSIPVVQSSLSATVAAGGIDASVTTIPTNTANLSATFAAHGRIVVDGEQIVYTGLSGNSFTGALRGFAGTAPVAHLVNAPIIQNQCLVRATGTSGQATRVVESAIQNGPWSDFLDGVSTAVTNAAGGASVGTRVTVLPAGDNLIIAMVAMRNTAAARTINGGSPGNLQLRRGVTTLASNLYNIDVGGGAVPNATVFPQKTYFFVHRDAGVAANQTYSINAQASNTNINAEVKMLVINSPPNSDTQTTQSANAGNGVLNTILSRTTPAAFPSGDNIVIASVQWNNTAGGGGGDRTIDVGYLLLDRSGGPTLAANEFPISISRSGRVNDNGGMLLVGRDANAPSGANIYRVRARANGANVQVEAKLIVISGVASARVDGASTALGASPTSLGSLNTAFPKLFPGGSNLVITATQYDTGAAARTIAFGGEDIRFSTTTPSSNDFQIDLCSSGTSQYCTDFAMGLMWRQTDNPNASPTFSVETTPSSTAAPTLSGEAKILGIHLNPIADRLEIFP